MFLLHKPCKRFSRLAQRFRDVIEGIDFGLIFNIESRNAENLLPRKTSPERKHGRTLRIKLQAVYQNAQSYLVLNQPYLVPKFTEKTVLGLTFL